jgi:PadR family transcriptional regulator, regulatory protein PadR
MYNTHMNDGFDAAVRRGSAEVLILTMLEERPRHGYEIAKLVERRSNGRLRFNVASFYPLLYQLEKRGLIKGRWLEKAGQRRRRYYRITRAGRTMLGRQRSRWEEFIFALTEVARLRKA